MSVGVWLSFLFVSVVLLAPPGPLIALAVTYAVSVGRSRAMVIVLAAVLGDFVAISASLLGAGAVLAHAPGLFTALKLGGAAILVLLGVWMSVRTSPSADGTVADTGASAAQVFWSGFAVTALHPGSFVFFGSFVPQFLDPARPLVPQLVLLGATFLVTAAVTTTLWVVAADRLQRYAGEASRRNINRIGGGVLVAIGVVACVAAVWPR